MLDERLEAGLGLVQPRLGLDPLGDVPDVDDHPGQVGVVEQVAADPLHPPVLAVVMQHPAGDDLGRAGLPGHDRQPGLHIREVVGVHEPGHVLAEERRGGPPEDRLARRAHVRDLAPGVEHDDGVGRPLEEEPQLPVGALLGLARGAAPR